MAVNTLVTGLIVFKILRVFLEVKAMSGGELTLGSLHSSSRGGQKLRHVLFVIIESGMVLFLIQLVRIVIININFEHQQVAVNLVSPIQQVLNVSIRSVHFYFFCFTDDIFIPR